MTDVLRTISDVRRWRGTGDVAAVYTMGALHEGHAELMRAARALCPTGRVIASIFVNPTQFGSSADLNAYPRTWDADLDVLRAAGVDALFAPSVDEMYPAAGTVTVLPGPLGSVLEGESRPGHFAGVLTVVAKLLNITTPTWAVFGEKDYQQLCLVRAMARELDVATMVVGVPTVREPDGLARSSRNVRLSPAGRSQATAVPASLQQVSTALSAGATPQQALDAGRQLLHDAGVTEVDYLVLTGEGLGPLPISGRARALVAAVVDGVRLIDNIAVEL